MRRVPAPYEDFAESEKMAETFARLFGNILFQLVSLPEDERRQIIDDVTQRISDKESKNIRDFFGKLKGDLSR